MTAFKQLGEHSIADSERWFPAIHEEGFVDLPAFYALALAGEAGELCNIIKKGVRVGSSEIWQNPHMVKEVAKEAADVFIYLVNLCQVMGINLWGAYETKHAELVERWGE